MKRILLLAFCFGLTFVSAVAQKSSISHFTYIQTEGIGKIAVRINEPKTPRYDEGAPVVVGGSAFFTVNTSFHNNDAPRCGAILVSYLWPGIEAGDNKSDGTFDYAGEDCMKAYRDVLRFATGEVADIEGKMLGDIVNVNPLYENAGLYAFSHQGIAATKVMGMYGDQFPKLKYFIGRENPTVPATSSMEIGHWGDDGKPVFNPYYKYPDDYSKDHLDINYEHIYWITDEDNPDGKPVFVIPGEGQYMLGDKVPRMWDKRFYSPELTAKLMENVFDDGEDWPEDVASPQMSADKWPERSSVTYYPMLKEKLPDLKVMLVFANRDHVQVAVDKPHIHQAFDGFREAGYWTRMNPDMEYLSSADPQFPETDDKPANSQPENWMQIINWSYPEGPAASATAEIASLAEMMDRVQYGDWGENLDKVHQSAVVDSPPPIPDNVVFIPSAAGGEKGICARIIEPENPRYSQGAPIAVFAVGGWKGAGIPVDDAGPHISDHGFIEVHFNMPGSGKGALESGGEYDMRGMNCQIAFSDVIKFAMGKKADTEGKYIADYTGGITPMHSNAGLLGLSNGGNMTTVTAGMFGKNLSELAWIVNWESPVGEGIPTALSGARGGPEADPPNPLRNPAYNPDDNTYDWDKLAYSNEVYFSSDGTQINGGLYFDVNENNVPDFGADYVLNGIIYEDKVYYTPKAVFEAESRAVYPPDKPAHFPAYSNTLMFWQQRNGIHWIEKIAENIPEILFIIEASDRDHVQTAPNHPHIVLQYDAFIDAGAKFVRLNPDRAYVNDILGHSQPDATDNDAFAEVGFDNVKDMLQPAGAVNINVGVFASACELADRHYYQNFDNNLDAVLFEPWSVHGNYGESPVEVFPNPSDDYVTFRLKESGITGAGIEIYNFTGAVVLSDNFVSEFRWSGCDNAGRRLPTGVYFYRIVIGPQIYNGKIILAADQ